MSFLSKAQFVILSTAAQRPDLSVLPLPEALRIRGAAVLKVLTSLRNKGLIETIEGETGTQRIVITGEGVAAVGSEAAEEAPAKMRKGERSPAGEIPVTEAAAAQGNTELGPPDRDLNRGRRLPLRLGTKQALMVEMLKRPEGATIQQIAEATGWRHHTVRGAISGTLKKKLGLSVKTTRMREVDPDKTGARGTGAVYRIPG
jgi:hypothetical protein